MFNKRLQLVEYKLRGVIDDIQSSIGLSISTSENVYFKVTPKSAFNFLLTHSSGCLSLPPSPRASLMDGRVNILKRICTEYNGRALGVIVDLFGHQHKYLWLWENRVLKFLVPRQKLIPSLSSGWANDDGPVQMDGGQSNYIL